MFSYNFLKTIKATFISISTYLKKIFIYFVVLRLNVEDALLNLVRLKKFKTESSLGNTEALLVGHQSCRNIES